MIRSDPKKTQERVRQLEEYMRADVLANGTFLCRHFRQCRTSRSEFPYYEGQLSHVGKHYDLEVDGRPRRIVIAAQEYGHGPSQVDLAARSEMIAGLARSGFRGRNPYMKGTASMLRLLVGREPGTDEEGERLLDGHIFDGFALVNYLLCSALRKPRDEYNGGAGKGHSSPTMRSNCGSHFLATLEILEPTVIIVQGQGVRQWLASALALPASGPTVESVIIGGKSIHMLTFDHPSASGKSGWWGGSPQSRYLRETVAPHIGNFLALQTWQT